MAANSCQPENIFSSSTCDIQRCPDCQMVHLNMGAITIRMTEQHFATYAIDISKALFHMRQSEIHKADMRMMM